MNDINIVLHDLSYVKAWIEETGEGNDKKNILTVFFFGR